MKPSFRYSAVFAQQPKPNSVKTLILGLVMVLTFSAAGMSSILFAESSSNGDRLVVPKEPPTEAATGFDSSSNGFVDQATHDLDLMTFDEVETVEKGLGPIYNAQSCRECHQSPVSGGSSQITELRVGNMDRADQFQNPDVPIAGGAYVIRARSVINDRAVCPNGDFTDTEVQEHAPEGMNVHALRLSLPLLGDGYVEAIPDSALLRIAREQCERTKGQVCGEAISVPVLEAPGHTRIARFGWKDQHASLLFFAADAYLNEIGVSNRLFPEDLTTLCKKTKDPEDQSGDDGLSDIDRFARFIRATKPPARSATYSSSPDAKIGEEVFSRIECDTCHTPSFVTAPAGSVINGGAFVVPQALGNRSIHPFSDFLLHDVGTGDAIVQNGGPETAYKIRTPPLWGLRLRSRLLHDGRALTYSEAIEAHAGDASKAVRNFRHLTDDEKRRLIVFLSAL